MKPLLRTLSLSCYMLIVVSIASWGEEPSMTEAEDTAQRGSLDWPDYRGPSRTGVYRGKGLLRQWGEQEPKELWRKPLGEGFSGISISDNLVVTMYADDDSEYIGAFNAEDGKAIWKQKLGSKFLEQFGNGPRATPTIADGVVYALGSNGGLVAARLSNGELLWRKELTEQYPITIPQIGLSGAPVEGSKVPLSGHSSSPIAVNDMILVQTGAGNGKSYVALDRVTGNFLWSRLDSEIGYSSPSFFHLAGEDQFVFVAHNELVGMRLDGKILWRHPWAITIAQPLFIPPNRIFVSTSYDVGSLLLELGNESSEAYSTKEVWRARTFRNMWGSSAYYGGYIYGFDNATLKCISAENGELAWAKRGLGKGNLIIADGLLIVLGDRGDLVLSEATPEGFVEAGARQVFDGRSWTAPSIAHGVLYLRDHENLVALDLTK